MTINPRDYDLDELRKMARQRGNGMGDEDVPDPTDLDMGLDDSEEEVLAGSSFRSGLYRELLPFLGGDAQEKPYLETLPETYAAEFVVFEWLEFLLMHSGYQGADEALDYYRSIDWITEDVQDDLSDYLLGIDESATNDDNELSVDDHMLSLVYIAKLTAMT
ncbi:FlaD/FlaE family flagellar protein [Haloarcula argentinensis]|uniref:Flagella E n=1 Tax=Haloarcula argentinensis TaxID=43776 RepID=A0A830FVB4_HALAR|nr:FlaD/FlaE family flagellar protein [Haloarcula argentinensis]EMA18529.1 flagella-like protein E [Haloarcula argentinensis DSM 12282]MDS0253912.1 flagella E [Haloarcula argentinensis]GGM45747.1 flagella E [Haloarcula argentinensis]